MVLTFETENEVTKGMQIWLRQRKSARKEPEPDFPLCHLSSRLTDLRMPKFYGSHLTLPLRVCDFKLKPIASGHFLALMIYRYFRFLRDKIATFKSIPEKHRCHFVLFQIY